MNAAVFCYSRTGIQTAKRVSRALHDMDVSLYTLARLEEPGFLPIEPSVYALEFSRRDALIFVGACGIAVREIAPYVRDKKTDPAVLVIDERARHEIPLLSGHIGGANRLALRLSSVLGADPVITPATDVNGKFAVDEFAARTGCAISDMQLAKAFAAGILERDLPLASAFPIVSPLPAFFRSISKKTSRGFCRPAGKTAGRLRFILRRPCRPCRGNLQRRASSRPLRAWITSASGRPCSARSGCSFQKLRWTA